MLALRTFINYLGCKLQSLYTYTYINNICALPSHKLLNLLVTNRATGKTEKKLYSGIHKTSGTSYKKNNNLKCLNFNSIKTSMYYKINVILIQSICSLYACMT